KRPSVAGRAPLRTLPPDGGAVVVVVVPPDGSVVVVVVVGGPAHVPSAAQASNVLKKPSMAPQALPFLHLVAVLTIDAVTVPFFLRTQHTSELSRPQRDEASHFMMSLRHALFGMRAVRLAAWRVVFTQFL